MYAFTIKELRALTSEDLKSLKNKAQEGDGTAQWKYAMCILYEQVDSSKGESILTYLTPSSENKDEHALLLMGYAYEHATGVSKDYAKAIECYSKAYDLIYKISASNKVAATNEAKALKELETRHDKLVGKIVEIVTLKKFCQFKDKSFLFPWNEDTRKSIGKLLPQLSNDIAEFKELYANTITNVMDEKQGLWEFRYQDELLTPLEVMKSLAARDYFENFLKNNGFQTISPDPFFDNALGRCLIDDDDAYDNDYIIGGLLNMAGHEGNPLWQYRVGLWYEYCDNNLEPKTAAYWYEQAKKELPVAKTALERLQNSLNYKILINAKDGTAKDCQTLMDRSSKNPQNSIGWIIESALRGDIQAIQRLERSQFDIFKGISISSGKTTPCYGNSIFNEKITLDSILPFYKLLNEEKSADEKVIKSWKNKMSKEKEIYRKQAEEEAKRKAEEERKRIEAERKAKEESIRKAKEAEEAKRRAEEETKRRAEEAKRRVEAEAIRKAKEAEEAKRRAEEDAIRKAKEAEEAKHRKAEETRRRKEAEAAERKKREEEEKRKAEAIKAYEEQCNKLMAEIKKIDKKYNNLAEKWEKEGLSEYETLRKKLNDAEEKLEPLLKAAARKWWQIPFYESGTWTVQKCLSHERKNGKETLENYEEKKKKIEVAAEKLEQMLDTKGAELNKDLLETKLSESPKLFREYKKEVDEAFPLVDAIKIQISRLKDGRAVQMVKPEFSLKSLLKKVVIPAGVILFLLWIVKLCSGPTEKELMAKYDSISAPSSDGSRVVVLNGKKGIIWDSGHEMVEPKYDDISELLEDEVRIFEQNGKKGILKKNGEELTPPEYNEIRNPVSTDCQVVVKNDTLYIPQMTRICIVNGKMGLVRTKSGEANSENYHNMSLELGISFPAEYDTIFYSDDYKDWVGQK